MAIGRVRAALNVNRRKALAFLARCKAIYDGMEANVASFPNPNPPLPILLAQIQTAEKAHALVGTGVHGASAAREAAFSVVGTSLESERMYVQLLCDTNPEQAKTLIGLATMVVSGVGKHTKDLLGAKVVLPAGSVALDANSGMLDGTGRAKFFNWRFTTDGGKTFTVAPPTPEPRTVIANLPLLTMVGFQVSITVGKLPQSEWSQMVTILVH